MFSHSWKRKQNFLAISERTGSFSAYSWSSIRPFYTNIFHNRCNTIYSHPDAFYFCDGLIFTHFVMSKNFKDNQNCRSLMIGNDREE